jgi:photosystem II stability/assembly factor-like uncharacterized protein
MMRTVRPSAVLLALAVTFSGCSNGSESRHGASFWAATGSSVCSAGIGGRSFVARSDDGGLTWVMIASPGGSVSPATPIRRLTFLDRRRGFAAAGDRLWHTADGGDSWDDVTAGLNTLATDGSFQAEPPTAFLTTDGGRTWQRGEFPVEANGMVFEVVDGVED